MALLIYRAWDAAKMSAAKSKVMALIARRLQTLSNVSC